MLKVLCTPSGQDLKVNRYNQMSSRWLCLVLVVLHIEGTKASVSFSIRVPGEKIITSPGDTVTLPCSVTPTFHPDEVRWYRPDKYAIPIIFFKKPPIEKEVAADPQYKGRASLGGALEEGNASLKVENVTVADTGEYICYVQHDSWYEKGHILIEVRVLGSSPLISLTDGGNGQVNVTCISEGWSPQPTLTWTNRKGIEIRKGLHEMHSIDDEGLMTVSCWLLVSPLGSEGYICSVGLSDQEKTESRVALNLSRDQTYVDTQTGAWKDAVIAVLVLGLLGVSLLYIYKKGLIKWPKSLKTNGRNEIEREGENENLKSPEFPPEDTEETPGISPRDVIVLPPVITAPKMEDKGTNTEADVIHMPEWDYVKERKETLSLISDKVPPSLKVVKGKTVSCPQPERIHGHDKAFPHVLCKLDKDSLYWEVVIKKPAEKQSWYVGVCSDIKRTNIVPLTPMNGFWVLQYEKGTGLFVNTEPPCLVPTTKPFEKLGVFFSRKDKDTYTLSFYNADKGWPLCSFKCFKERGTLLGLLSPGVRDTHPLAIC
ncbi:hypothetical protein ACEWY4_007245 [Coilia grayii]|uniref:Uncharacterized protein n=1 Tax=Coilia grayii TaxID=363190 RepID=A0ABD1KFX0_9TELE